ncbi:MAG: hypothetical protein BWY75_01700 [bacterium ADurb.Bin425]|nr:MAG: hypothetical protein BWY75_01700 [bacterium ADurb.Bin425]
MKSFNKAWIEIDQVVGEIDYPGAIGQKTRGLSLNAVERYESGSSCLIGFEKFNATLSDFIIVDDYMTEPGANSSFKSSCESFVHPTQLTDSTVHAGNIGRKYGFHSLTIAALTLYFAGGFQFYQAAINRILRLAFGFDFFSG